MAALGGNDGSGALGIQLNNGDGMTIGMVMDWLENRLETITSEEDDVEVQGATGTGGGGGGVVREEDEPKVTKRERARERNGPAAKRTSPRVGRDMGPPPARTTSSQATTTAGTVIPPQLSAQQLQFPRSARTLSSSPPLSSLVTPRPTNGQPSATRSRTKHRNSAQASSSSFTFNAPLPTSTINPFERDFGSQHLSLSMDQSTDGATTTANENDRPLIMPELPQSLLGTKRRHSSIVSEIPDPSTHGTTTPGGPSSTASRERNGGQTSGGSSKRRNRGNGASASAGAGAGRVLGESQDANAMDVEEGSTTGGEPARKKVARR